MKTITICLSDASLELLTLLTDEDWDLDLRAVVQQLVADGLEAYFVPKNPARVDGSSVAEAPSCSGLARVYSLDEARLRRAQADSWRDDALTAAGSPPEVA